MKAPIRTSSQEASMKVQEPVSVLLIAAFVHFTVSCTATIRRAPEQLAGGKKVYKIARLETTSGETIRFGKGTVARVQDDEVRLTGAIALKPGEYSYTSEAGRELIKTADGRSYPADRAVMKRKFVLVEIEPGWAMSLAGISAVWTRQTNVYATVALVAAGVFVAVMGGVGLYLLITGESLSFPMIYFSPVP
jgi:hypothetical protein